MEISFGTPVTGCSIKNGTPSIQVIPFKQFSQYLLWIFDSHCVLSNYTESPTFDMFCQISKKSVGRILGEGVHFLLSAE